LDIRERLWCRKGDIRGGFIVHEGGYEGQDGGRYEGI